MRQILFFCGFFAINSLYASVQLTGKVVDSDHNPVDYFNVVLLSPKDSSMITGGNFTDGKFRFANLKEQAYLIKVSGLGFVDFRQSITVTNATELAPVVLQTKALKEVSVTARRPVIQSKADRTIVTVEGSILSNAINGNDMLQKTPGLIRDPKTGDFTVAGKGAPVFYIDGKEVHSMEEVKALNPQNIKTIEIIDNPSSAYDAEGHAVVLITTIKHTDKYLLLVGSNFTQSRRSSGDAYFEGVLTTGIVTTNIYYDGTINNGKTYENNYSNLSSDNNMTTLGASVSHNHEHDYRLSVDISPSKKHTLSFQSDGYFSAGGGNRFQNTQFSALAYQDFNTYINQYGKFNQFNGTLNYSWQIDSLGQNLKIVGDYTKGGNDYGTDYYNVVENDMMHVPYWNTTHNLGKPVISSLRVDYMKPFCKIYKLEAGSRLYHITENNHADLTGSTALNQHYQTTEQNIAVYVSLSAKFSDKVNARLGLRGEDTYRKALKNSVLYTNTTQFGFFPSLLINYDCSKQFTVGFSYSKRISRPSFAALDPSIYTDSLLNRQGNPNLKATDIHAFLVTMKFFSSFSIRTGYNYKINPIYFLVYKDTQNRQMTDCRFVNGTNTGNFFLSTSYNKSICKWWSTSISSSISTNSYIYYDDNNVQRNNNHPKCNGNIQNTFTLPWNITFDTGFQYNGTGSMSTIYITKPAWSLFGSLQKGFLHNALMCTLSANDIFRKNISYQQSVLKGNNLNVFDGDTRSIQLSIKYQIGKSNYQYQSHSATQEEKSRIN